MGFKSYDGSDKLSIVEQVVNGEPGKGPKVFFENGDYVKASVVSFLVGSNDTNEVNKIEG